MVTATLTKPRPKKERRTPRQPLPRRRLQYVGEIPGGIHMFECYSMTRLGREVEHKQEIDLHTLEARCSCEDFTYRHAQHQPRITKDEHLCKHLKRCVDFLIRNDKWEPVAATEQRCSHCGAKGAEHEMCDEAGNALPERLCSDCLETVRRMLDPTPDPVPDWVPDEVPGYEPEQVQVWDGGEEAYP